MIELTYAYGKKPKKFIIRKTLIIQVTDYEVDCSQTEKQQSMNRDVGCLVTVRKQHIEKRYGEDESHVLDTSILYVRESYQEVRDLMMRSM